VPTTVLLCRHAEVDNPKSILYGRLPGFGLSSSGRRQAERLAGYLAGEPLTAIYTSPLLRARQTATMVSQFHPSLQLRYSTRLVEVFTSWQGRPWTELRGAMYYDPPADPGDEKMFEVAGRVRDFVEWVVRRRPGETVCAVSHGDPIAIYLMALHGVTLSEQDLRRQRTYYPDLASVNRLTFDSNGELLQREYVSPRSQPETVRL
jgi:broad specificity phosphatase PhoE